MEEMISVVDFFLNLKSDEPMIDHKIIHHCTTHLMTYTCDTFPVVIPSGRQGLVTHLMFWFKIHLYIEQSE